MAKTLLVAVDGSEPSLKGAQLAVELSTQLGLALQLVYVIPPVLLPPTVYADTIKKIDEGNVLHAKDVLAKALRVVTDLGGRAETVMVNGSPAEAIAELAKAEGVWAVVIGARGHGVIGRVLLGSVADRVLHICPRPVLVVR